MLPPLLKIAFKRPDILKDLFRNYADVFGVETRSLLGHAIKKAIAWGIAVSMFFIFAILAGVAIMLGLFNQQFLWIWVIVPAVPLVLALIALIVALRNPLKSEQLKTLRQEFMADMQWLKSGDPAP